MARDATLGDRLAIWRSRKAEPVPQLHSLPPLPLTGDPARAEALLAKGSLPEGNDLSWLNDMAELGDERAGRFAAGKVAEWVTLNRSGWTAGVTGWRLLHWLAHARFLYPRGVPAEAVAALAGQADFLHRRWQAATGWDRIAALAGLSAAAHALDRPALRPAEPALPPLPADPEGLLRAFVLLLSLRETWDRSGPVPDFAPAIAGAARALRAMRHADGHLTRLRGGTGGDPARMDAALVASAVRAPPPAQAMGLARLVRGRSTVIADLSRPALAFEMTYGRTPLILSVPAARAEPAVEGRPPRPAPVTDITLGAFGVSGRHEGWAGRNLLHARSLTLSSDGHALSGRDTFEPTGRIRGSRRIALQFPLHPDVVAKATDGRIALILPGGEGWIFTGEGAVFVPHLHRIVVNRPVDRFPARFDWTFAKSDATALTIRDQPAGA